ncbi:MAG: FAD:protein FMN transferase [Magnetococcales bacterium]|nr:FAD:protein FMN transferase [Magnetococcales bacterium]
MEYSRFDFHAMGSACALQLYAAEHTMAMRAAQAVVDEVNRIEMRYSRYRADSVLSVINQAAHSAGGITVDAETAGLLDYAFACHARSAGLFDISSGVLRRAWSFAANQLPDPEQVRVLLLRVGMDKMVWDSPVVRFLVPCMELDLGGLGKEYAADRAVTLCIGLGIRHGLVDLGGDLAIIGPHPDGTPWRIGIQHPGQADGVLAMLSLSEGGLASSGDYERGMTIAGQRFSHILDPRTGWPVQGLASVSVVADRCLVAGSLSTIGMLKGAAGIPWLRDLGVPHLWMDAHGQCGGSLAMGTAA